MITLIIFCRTGTNSQIKPGKFLCNKQTLLKEWNQLDQFIEFIKLHQPDFPFYLALVVNGKIISEKKNGYATKKTKTKLNHKTIHYWGSVSKLFMVVSVLQLVEQNKVSLEDPIVKWLPELGKGIDSLGNMKSVKLSHLLNHTSGLRFAGYRKAQKKSRADLKKKGLPYHPPTTDDFIPYLKFTIQYAKPGKKYRYSNIGYSVIGIILEKITRMKFREYVKQHIFDVLGMKNTFYGPIPAKKVKQLETHYVKYRVRGTGEIKHIERRINRSQGMLGANGGVRSTSQDMLKFMIFFRFRDYRNKKYHYEKVLKKETLEKYIFATNLRVKNNNTFSKKPGHRYATSYKVLGMDFKIGKVSKSKVYGHSGRIGYARSYFIFNKQEPFGIMLMTTMDSDPKGLPRKIAAKLLEVTDLFILKEDFMSAIESFKNELEK